MLDDTPLTDVTRRIIGAAIEVHRILGPGLLESTYQLCLTFELTERGIHFTTEDPIPVIYKSLVTHDRYRVDLVVENLVVVELKAVERLLPVHQAQLLTYMRATGCPCGLLINFNVDRLTNGLKRLVNMRPRER